MEGRKSRRSADAEAFADHGYLFLRHSFWQRKRTFLTLLATVAVSIAGDHDVLRSGPVFVADSKEDCKKLEEIAEDHDLRTALENQQ
jgi:hypothetical protein